MAIETLEKRNGNSHNAGWKPSFPAAIDDIRGNLSSLKRAKEAKDAEKARHERDYHREMRRLDDQLDALELHMRARREHWRQLIAHDTAETDALEEAMYRYHDILGVVNDSHAEAIDGQQTALCRAYRTCEGPSWGECVKGCPSYVATVDPQSVAAAEGR